MNSDMWSSPRIIPVPCNEVDDFDFKFVAEKRVDTNIFHFRQQMVYKSRNYKISIVHSCVNLSRTVSIVNVPNVSG